MSLLPFSLYHGTSTLFLKDIIESGLGGVDPVEKWKILEFAKAIAPIVNEHLSSDDNFMVKANTFMHMVNQTSSHSNYQHGDTYLSPSMDTAVRYASNKRYGSEILTYSLDFLEELIRRDIGEGIDDLYQKYPRLFGFLDISPAPLIIEVIDYDTDWLLTEFGNDATKQIEKLVMDYNLNPDDIHEEGQQDNFRLINPVPSDSLKIWLLNVTRWHPIKPEYQKIQLDLTSIKISS
jgi:hypothetical protein